MIWRPEKEIRTGYWVVLRLGRRHLVLMRPNPAQLGHLGLEMMMGIRLAKCFRAPLWIIRPDRVVASAPYELISDEVRMTVIRGWRGSLLTRLFFNFPRGLFKTKPLQYGTVPSFLFFTRMSAFASSISDVWQTIKEQTEMVADRARGAGRRFRKRIDAKMRVQNSKEAAPTANANLEVAAGKTKKRKKLRVAKGEGKGAIALAARKSDIKIAGGTGESLAAIGNGDGGAASTKDLDALIRRPETTIQIDVPNRPTCNPTYFKRIWVDQVAPLRIPPDQLPALEAYAEEAFGIGPEARIVTLHMREAGFKLGREVHDAKPGHRVNDSTRNVSHASYEPAIRYLAEQGYTVVRIGDSSMTPIRHEGLIDLATSPKRTDMFEFYCVARSDFFVGCESGASILAWLGDRPVVTVNATEPLSGSYPVRESDIYVLKRVRDRAGDRMLHPLEMLYPEYLNFARNLGQFEYFDNTPEDILDAIKDMIDVVAHGVPLETPEQREFRFLALAVGVRMRLRNSVIRKWGPHHGFIGRGRIAPGFARKYMRGEPEQLARAAADYAEVGEQHVAIR